ncbi:hypothetical protein ACIPW5_29555 [Streptomyces sp. NPDC090077]|uniref:hypothetical protein n=1 Tax=Streptomyces sp. NPDC090077 TaxID=3365938 RepID=UPI0037F72CBF
MDSDSLTREIVQDLRRRVLAGDSTLSVLRWLKSDLEGRGVDPEASSFVMIRMLRRAFDIGLSPARLVASWDELSDKGYLSSEELVQRLGPLIPRTKELYQ